MERMRPTPKRKASRRTVDQLLTAATKDTDAASVFWDGSCNADSDRAIIVIKGRAHCDYVIEMLQRQNLLTAGKDVETAKPVRPQP